MTAFGAERNRKMSTTISSHRVAAAQGLRVPYDATGLEGTANPAEDLDDFPSPARAFFIDRWIFDTRGDSIVRHHKSGHHDDEGGHHHSLTLNPCE